MTSPGVEIPRRRDLRRLRYIAIALPAAFLATVAFMAQLVLPPFMPPFAIAIGVVGLELLAVCAFALFVFQRIERGEAGLERQSLEQAALLELSRDIAVSTNTPRVLDAVAVQAMNLLDASTARVCLVGRERQELVPCAQSDSAVLPCGLSGPEGLSLRAARDVLSSPGPVDLSNRPGFCPRLDPGLSRSHLAAPVRGQHELLGAICVGSSQIDAWDEAASKLLENLANLTAVAVQKDRLQQQVAALAIVEERDRIAMELHDGIIQTIYGVGLSLEKAVAQATDDPARAGSSVERAIGELNGVIQDVRDYIFRLERSEVDASDLRTGLTRLAAEIRQHASLNVDVDVADAGQLALGDGAAPHLLQVAREALSNVVRHSGSREAFVRLGPTDDGQIELTVRDEGCGFDASVASSPGGASGGYGLVNMAERARLLGGALTVNRAASGGTELRVRVPAAAASISRVSSESQ